MPLQCLREPIWKTIFSVTWNSLIKSWQVTRKALTTFFFFNWSHIWASWMDFCVTVLKLYFCRFIKFLPVARGRPGGDWYFETGNNALLSAPLSSYCMWWLNKNVCFSPDGYRRDCGLLPKLLKSAAVRNLWSPNYIIIRRIVSVSATYVSRSPAPFGRPLIGPGGSPLHPARAVI